MSDAIESIANELEDHGSNRIDLRDVTNSQRHQIAKWLVVARAQVNATNSPDDTLSGSYEYADHLIDKKNQYFYACGNAGIDIKEANLIWYSVVYNELTPHRRKKNI